MEAIIGKREIGGVVQYQVKWENYPASDSTWEPEENLEESVAAIQKYEQTVELAKKEKKSLAKTRGEKRSAHEVDLSSSADDSGASEQKSESPAPSKKHRGPGTI